ncbi:MAG: L-histidine N(alpha)-methyltransferase [Rhodanobacter sp.]
MSTPQNAFFAHAHSVNAAMLVDVGRGLRLKPKQLSSKYFYDARGSELFEQICEQPEYYLARAELEIMRTHATDIAAMLGPDVLLIEYGSGSGLKTRLLLEQLRTPVAYVPVEASPSALAASLVWLAPLFPHVQMLPLCADFTADFCLPIPARQVKSTIVYFPGSTLGNFDKAGAVGLLRKMRTQIGATGAVLIGVDLKKDRTAIEAAYNDNAGVTAEFTLNMLARFNRELGANFELAKFRHRARYNVLAGRIETHIVSRCAQQVIVCGERFHFAPDEAMLVEYSCKYSPEECARIAARAGLHVEGTWTDALARFSVQCLRAF